MAMAKSTLDQLKIEAGEKIPISDHSARWLPGRGKIQQGPAQSARSRC